MIVLFGGEKGGTGKITLATNLAVWLARQGRDVLFVDTDFQRTASPWVDRRNALNGLATIHCAERHGNVFHALRDLVKRYDVEPAVLGAGLSILRGPLAPGPLGRLGANSDMREAGDTARARGTYPLHVLPRRMRSARRGQGASAGAMQPCGEK